MANIAGTPASFKLRPYQSECIEAVEGKFREFPSLLITLPTGGGKTVVFAEIARRRLPGRTLVLAHREELIAQAAHKIEAIAGVRPGIDMAGLRSDGSEPVVCGSIQTLARGRELPGEPFDLMVIDEAHHAAADSYKRVVDRFSPRHLLGCTATPYRGDKKSLACVFEEEAFNLGIMDLIGQGFLADIRVRTLPATIDLSSVRVQQGDFSEADLGEAVAPALAELAAIVARDYADRKLLTFCPLRATSRVWTDALTAHGLPAAHVDGESSDREAILSAFTADRIRFLSNAMLLTEGYDEPSIDTILILRPTKSRGLFSQMIGRGTRIFSGKPHLLVLDPIFLAERYSIAGVPDLAAANADQAARIKHKLAEGLDLTSAIKEAEREAKIELEKTLREYAGRTGYERCLGELALELGDAELAGFEPVFGWHSEQPTPKQLGMLLKCGVPADTVAAIQLKGHASEIISHIVKRRDAGLATLKQVRYARRLGHTQPELLGFEEAKAWIDRKLEGRAW
jgi:superfamily II DNA or RNA helicase